MPCSVVRRYSAASATFRYGLAVVGSLMAHHLLSPRLGSVLARLARPPVPPRQLVLDDADDTVQPAAEVRAVGVQAQGAGLPQAGDQQLLLHGTPRWFSGFVGAGPPPVSRPRGFYFFVRNQQTTASATSAHSETDRSETARIAVTATRKVTL